MRVPELQYERRVIPRPVSIHGLADIVNKMSPGTILEGIEYEPEYNWWKYADWYSHLRACVTGSAFGVMMFDKISSIRTGWRIYKLPEGGERVYDRDGYPFIPNVRDELERRWNAFQADNRPRLMQRPMLKPMRTIDIANASISDIAMNVETYVHNPIPVRTILVIK